jgi:hypothetical protein
MDANPNLIVGRSSSWLWLFNSWDSAHFTLIAQQGYVHPNYVFLPAYPILIRLVGSVIGDYWFGAFLVTQSFAFGSLVMFQLLARFYMEEREALCATLLIATFPYISVFTTLAFSEALFLLSSVSVWYLYKKRRMGLSSFLAGVASITRIYGIAIIVPIFLDIVKSKDYRKLFHLTVPVAFLASWFLFCYLATGDPLASWSDEATFTVGSQSKFSLAQTIMNQLIGKAIGATPVPFYIDPPILMSLSLFAYLIVKTWQVDHLLSAYAVLLFGAFMVTTVNHLSILRFLSFVFPIWLTIRVSRLTLAAVCIAFFVPVTLLLWFDAINVTFIG